MSSPCTLKINKLRRKNRALLDQLETNSALLEHRLKKLKHTAKTEKRSDKSWEDLPPSPLKRKFEYWKARNYSGQVSAALHRDLCDCKQNSSDTMDAELQLKENMEKSPVTSPAKRTRHSVLIVSNPRRKSQSKPRKKPHSPRKTSVTTTTVTKTPVKCSTCHSRKLTYENETSLNEGESSSSSAACICNCNKVWSPKRYSIEKEKKKCMDKRTLEAVKSMLNYSPQSVFLKQIKKRSQTLENLLSPGNIRKSPKVFPTYAKSMETVSDRITETKKAKVSPIKYTYFDKTSVGSEVAAGSNREFSSRPIIAKSSIKDLPNKTRGKLLSADIYNRPMRAKSTPRDFYSKSPPRDVPSKIITAKLPLNRDFNEDSPMIETKNTRKTRKHVCYRKNCYCRVQQRKPKPKKKTVEDVKENLTKEDSLMKDVSSSEDLTSPRGCHCCCHCDHQRKSPPPKTQLLTTNTISSLVDNEVENKYIHGQCCGCDKDSGWFNKLNEFRQSHYFDCHAHPSSLSLDSARNWETMSGQPLGHKCIHKYTVDDRFFAKPLYSDHQNNSRCSICHLPLGTAKTGRDELLPITLPSKLDEPIIQVSVPLQKNKHMSPRTSNSSYKKFSHTVSRDKTNSPKIKSRLTSSTVGDFRAWMPPPADSLALRYQKGVIK